jgi:hypothetical protein
VKEQRKHEAPRPEPRAFAWESKRAGKTVVDVDETNGSGSVREVIFDMRMSLGGFVTGPNVRPEEPKGDGGLRLIGWVFGEEERDRDILAESGRSLNSLIAGRRTYDLSVPWWKANGPTGAAPYPVFVPSHRPPGPSVTNLPLVRYVTDGIESAIARAKVEAGDGNVCAKDLRRAAGTRRRRAPPSEAIHLRYRVRR